MPILVRIEWVYLYEMRGPVRSHIRVCIETANFGVYADFVDALNDAVLFLFFISFPILPFGVYGLFVFRLFP